MGKGISERGRIGIHINRTSELVLGGLGIFAVSAGAGAIGMMLIAGPNATKNCEAAWANPRQIGSVIISAAQAKKKLLPARKTPMQLLKSIRIWLHSWRLFPELS